MGQQEDGVQRPSLSSYTLWQEALKSLCFTVCSGEGKAEPAPLLTGTMSREPNKLWLWDSPLLVPISTLLLVCTREQADIPRGSSVLCEGRGQTHDSSYPLPTCIQPFLSFVSAHVVSTVIQA